MRKISRFLPVVLWAVSTTGVLAQTARTQPAKPDHAKEWHFVVSGDSRNCGDLIMPAIAAGAARHNAAFYWHLGDFRWISQPDNDILDEINPKTGTARPAIAPDQYQRMAWDDFLQMQIASFDEAHVPVFLGIGNHETIAPKDRQQYLAKFGERLDTPVLKKQRLQDDPSAQQPQTYYHWIQDGVDFIYLDNATAEEFDKAQMSWLNRVLERDHSDPSVRSIVVGMHEALPDSLSNSHSMGASPQGIQSGRCVYKSLARAQKEDHKNVYVLASHSHFFMENIYESDFWRKSGEPILPGWIVGTAGAVRYRLPSTAPKNAKTDVYGYLLATVNAGGKPGVIQFEFKEIHKTKEEGDDFIPQEVWKRFSGDIVEACFKDNKDMKEPKEIPEPPDAGCPQ